MLQIPEIALGDTVFKPMLRRVYSGGDVIELTEQESYVFEALALCANTMVTRRMLCAVLQARYRRIISADNVTVSIHRLRRALRSMAQMTIYTVDRDGYRLATNKHAANS